MCGEELHSSPGIDAPTRRMASTTPGRTSAVGNVEFGVAGVGNMPSIWSLTKQCQRIDAQSASCPLDVRFQSTAETTCAKLADAENEGYISPEQALRAFGGSCCSGSQSKQEQARASAEAEVASFCIKSSVAQVPVVATDRCRCKDAASRDRFMRLKLRHAPLRADMHQGNKCQRPRKKIQLGSIPNHLQRWTWWTSWMPHKGHLDLP